MSGCRDDRGPGVTLREPRASVWPCARRFSYFRDAWDDILDRWEREEATDKLLSLASVIWRPDAIVVRGVRRGLNAIRELGFVPVAAAI